MSPGLCRPKHGVAVWSRVLRERCGSERVRRPVGPSCVAVAMDDYHDKNFIRALRVPPGSRTQQVSGRSSILMLGLYLNTSLWVAGECCSCGIACSLTAKTITVHELHTLGIGFSLCNILDMISYTRQLETEWMQMKPFFCSRRYLVKPGKLIRYKKRNWIEHL